MTEGFSHAPSSVALDLWLTVASVYSTVSYWLLPVIDEASAHNGVCTSSPRERWNQANVIVHMSFGPHFPAEWTLAVVPAPPPMLQWGMSSSMVLPCHCHREQSYLDSTYSVRLPHKASGFVSHPDELSVVPQIHLGQQCPWRDMFIGGREATVTCLVVTVRPGFALVRSKEVDAGRRPARHMLYFSKLLVKVQMLSIPNIMFLELRASKLLASRMKIKEARFGESEIP